MTPHRITTRQSSEHVVVRAGDTVLADSTRPLVLSERGLPDRYYLPREDVRLDLLTPSSTTSHCPFKGDAAYFSADGVPDAFWVYDEPIDGRAEISGLLAPWPGRVEVLVDGSPV
jgi:uncharacterized protein (DUF427 family)